MDDNILIYEVQSGDTLDKIAGGIGMSGDQLKDFHNAYCEKMERLWFNNLVGVRQIIIPKHYKSPEQLTAEREKELPLPFATADFYQESYDAKESISDVFEKHLDLEYKVKVDIVKSQDQSDAMLANVTCYDFKKDGATPDDKMSAVSLACMEAIYPISFIIPFHGQVSGIFGFENLKKRFENKRPELEEFFTGEIYTSYFDKFLSSIGNMDYVLKHFSSTLLYQLLFPKMEWFHKKNSWAEYFFFSQNSFPVKCSMSAYYNHEGTEIVETFLKGNITEKCSLQELLRGIKFGDESADAVEGEIEVRYITDKKSKKMLQAEASMILKNDGEIYRKQTLKLSKHE